MFVVLALDIPLNDDTVTPGFLGFGVFIALAVATYFLIRSMNKQMRKIQAPREADIKQEAWEREQAAKAGKAGAGEKAEAKAAPSDPKDG
ncbi:hypothetical protein [Actinomadura sp. 21ATH]|uniref:hypothetical protein n=1 Tax=Actinomadura sp. 21ATH TaxID=1735444 RepID=UPI0035BF44FE